MYMVVVDWSQLTIDFTIAKKNSDLTSSMDERHELSTSLILLIATVFVPRQKEMNPNKKSLYAYICVHEEKEIPNEHVRRNVLFIHKETYFNVKSFSNYISEYAKSKKIEYTLYSIKCFLFHVVSMT
jgi:hypothetical protein